MSQFILQPFFRFSYVISSSLNSSGEPPMPADETINFSLVERGRSLMDPQPHPLLHFLIRVKPTSMNVFLQVVKNVEVRRGKIWGVQRMSECFPAKSLKLSLTKLAVRRLVLLCKRMIPLDSIPGRCDFMALVPAPSSTKKRTTSLCCSLLASISNTG